MGANQSSDAGGTRGPGDGGRRDGLGVKTCYYDILGIDRQASDDDIKKAYRKKALELHPDRNYGNVEETTRKFAEVQSAYEILADPQERAWYDSHRDAILRNSDDDGVTGGYYEHNVRFTTAQDITRMFTRFHGALDFSDSPSGFYGVLRATFHTLADEENSVGEWENLDGVEYPSFGEASDQHDGAVKNFYAVWSGFATKKTFSWEDVYRYSEAPDRRVRRMMEKENKRLREEAIREFNDAVRSLVAFVKKRDPRFKPNVQTEAERQKILKDASIAQAARSRAANKARHDPKPHTVPAWVKSGEPQEDEFSEESENDIRENFECVVCNKNFKSEKQYEAHENSKKHAKAVQNIRLQMQREDQELTQNTSGQDNVPLVEQTSEDKSKDGLVSSVSEDAGDEVDVSYGPDSEHTTSPLPTQEHVAKTEAEYVVMSDIGSDQAPSSKTSASSSDDDYTTQDEFKDRVLGRKDETGAVDPNPPGSSIAVEHISSQLASESLNADVGEDLTLQPRMGKAKEKRAKKAAQKSSGSAGSDVEFRCASCQAGFPSKSRLFNHIKDFGHAAPISKPTKGGKGKKR